DEQEWGTRRRVYGASTYRDRQQLRGRSAVDHGVGLLVRGEVVSPALPAEHVVGEQRDQFRQIARDGTVEGEAPTGELECVHGAIVPEPAHHALCSRPRSSRTMSSWPPPTSSRALSAVPS